MIQGKFQENKPSTQIQVATKKSQILAATKILRLFSVPPRSEIPTKCVGKIAGNGGRGLMTS